MKIRNPSHKIFEIIKTKQKSLIKIKSLTKILLQCVGVAAHKPQTYEILAEVHNTAAQHEMKTSIRK